MKSNGWNCFRKSDGTDVRHGFNGFKDSWSMAEFETSGDDVDHGMVGRVGFLRLQHTSSYLV
jgi:hypothetical protein